MPIVIGDFYFLHMGIIDNIKTKAYNLLGNSLRIPLSSNSFMGFGRFGGTWNNLLNNIDYLKAFEHNPCVNAVINIRATASANIRFSLEDLDGNEIKPTKYNKQQKRTIELLKNPNPLQSTSEWWKQNNIFQDVFGNSFMYASYPSGFGELEDITSLTNIWSQHMTPTPTGLLFDATKKSDIIKNWIFSFGTVDKTFETETILHTNDSSISLTADGVILGASRLKPLKEPINNSYKALISRGVLIDNRGAQGIISSAAKDAVTGTTPLGKKGKQEVQEDFKDYGIQKDQFQYIISKQAIQFTRTVLPIKDLQLFEEVAISTQHIALEFNVPNDLVILYLQGATYTNQKESMIRLYNDAIIPTSESRVNSLNNFLKTETYGFRIKGSYDHVAVLQQNIKERSDVIRNNVIAFDKAFKSNITTVNEYRASMFLKPETTNGDKKITELSDKELQIMGINLNTQDNGTD